MLHASSGAGRPASAVARRGWTIRSAPEGAKVQRTLPHDGTPTENFGIGLGLRNGLREANYKPRGHRGLHGSTNTLEYVQ